MTETIQTALPTPEEIHSAHVQGLYANAEHDACGVGFVAHLKGVASHAIVAQGLQILENLDHRGAVGADPLMGDGAGLLIQIPDAFYRAEMARQGVPLPPPGEYGVGMVFLPKEAASRQACVRELERAIAAEGQVLLGWRNVPVDTDLPMSPAVRSCEPIIRQVFIGRGGDVLVPDALERKLYVIRKTASARITGLQLTHSAEYYVPSMSCRTVIYKGLLLADQVGQYYLDLQDERVVSALALVHQRFSTNTFPSWPLAHPYRMVAHNGEINTVKGNFNWMRAREGVMRSPVLGDDLAKLYPITMEGQSDTATFDNTLELLVMAGYPLAQAIMMMIPEAWEQHTLMDAQQRAFYEYHAAMLEPWDGPAAMVFTDGRQIGATLDRNGLRPARFIVTDDDLVVLASEAGVLPIAEERIVRKWRLQPGRMFLIDLEQGRIVEDGELKRQYAHARPYRQWIDNVRVRLDGIPAQGGAPSLQADALNTLQQAFGYSQEDLQLLLAPMALNGEEGIGSMGNDAPLAVLSQRSKPLTHYFRQLFAQVTNPPIDPIREAVVMSLVSFIGPRPNLLDINAVNPPLRLEVGQPVLDFDAMARLRQIELHTGGKLRSCEIDITYPAQWGADGIEARLASLCSMAVQTIQTGSNILILTDRGMRDDRVAIPALLALSSIHHHLVREGLRTAAGLVVETGSAREVHHFAVLAGYGAEAVHPWLALESLAQMAPGLGLTAEKAQAHFIKAVGKGLSKIMSKMGISTYMSYCGAQIFEAVGLSAALVDKYFHGTASQIGGLGIFDVAEEALRHHRAAYARNPALQPLMDAGGEYAWRANGEEHMWTPDAIAKLQHSTRAGRYDSFEEYARIINDQSERQMTLRGLFALKIDPARAVPLDEVEPAAEIVKRFATGAMSLGSISTEAHVNLAIAMNRLGGKSNTGEGGEDEIRYTPLPNGDSMRSAIKQVASGRFGVTSNYLTQADELQIKMAQGAKPGEGGQLPGHKVDDWIARVRHATPGVGLISPPPHHDIYSIEDLAQLIFDLKNANRQARINVKLVSKAGVGTIAAGVAKAHADVILIAGYDGGTGASPISSIKHAGLPWELGLAESHQTLVKNKLRNRVVLQTDGQLKTGRDIAIATLLGAEEWGVATAALVAGGCIMMRKCHLNTCPVGVATQDPELRKLFSGKPEHIVNLFRFLAEDLREIMAELGFRTINEMVGRAQFLKKRTQLNHWKTSKLDFSGILYVAPTAAGESLHHTESQDHGIAAILDWKLLEQAGPALNGKTPVFGTFPVKNTDRTLGTLLSNEISKRYGSEGLPDNTINYKFTGSAGQSFGAFATKGLSFELEGEANDYVGKGLSGAQLAIYPAANSPLTPHENIIIGNVALYGATSGHLFVCGQAGERFAVRNSGATAVVDGVGDHGCEYMTGGRALILGETGRNFAAGMSGGIAWVYDYAGTFRDNCNTEMVDLDPLEAADETAIIALLKRHIQLTNSQRAEYVLQNWGKEKNRFIKVFPREYKNVLQSKLVEA